MSTPSLRSSASLRAARGLAWRLACLIAAAVPAFAAAHTPEHDGSSTAAASTAASKPRIDRSGRTRVGEASFYADRFAGRKMANGERMRPESNNAASRTLPLGTRARVTNLENGRSALVEIKDRGPYVDGRIVDLSPRTAEQLDMVDDGVVRVEVAPIALPERKDDRVSTSSP